MMTSRENDLWDYNALDLANRGLYRGLDRGLYRLNRLAIKY